ncbi:MAG: 6-phosphogluconolactonase [Gammaproteobacteria bacterium]|nr:6-phosphogluconolactonase [Gammaproteobacteria bacterium]
MGVTVNVSNAILHIARNGAELGEITAAYWCRQARNAIEDHGAFYVALSGGSTPRLLFEHLALPSYRDAIDWTKVFILFGDERCVPKDHEDSNFRMARETLLAPLGIREENVYRIQTERGPDGAALDYAETLARVVPGGMLDLVMLGLGPDGHIASLFPGTAALNEGNTTVVPVFVEKFSSWRITITFPVLAKARRIMLLTAGEGKAAIVAEILDKESNHEPYPVEMIRAREQIDFFMDEGAAGRLEGAL